MNSSILKGIIRDRIHLHWKTQDVAGGDVQKIRLRYFLQKDLERSEGLYESVSDFSIKDDRLIIPVNVRYVKGLALFIDQMEIFYKDKKSQININDYVVLEHPRLANASIVSESAHKKQNKSRKNGIKKELIIAYEKFKYDIKNTNVSKFIENYTDYAKFNLQNFSKTLLVKILLLLKYINDLSGDHSENEIEDFFSLYISNNQAPEVSVIE